MLKAQLRLKGCAYFVKTIPHDYRMPRAIATFRSESKISVAPAITLNIPVLRINIACLLNGGNPSR